mmetsp:Transcript_2009/g.5581  ORF Transcript_2009/g.5581 Transcript_2009/m.5581 type:complete len:86 (+) Transcript_2009:48-305(+)
MPRVKVLLFAAAREAAGAGEVEVQLEEGQLDTAALREALAAQHPALAAPLKSSALAVNMDYAPPGQPQAFREGDELAVIPPISGG